MSERLTKLRFNDDSGNAYPKWEEKQLGDLEDDGIITMGRGKVISKTDIENHPGNYPVYSSSAKNNGLMGTYGKYMFDDERISWSVDGGGRFFYRPPHKYSVTNVSGWIKPEGDDLSVNFLFHALDFEWRRKVLDYLYKAHPSVIRQMYTLRLPSLPEQQKIASFLSSLDERIEKLSELNEQQKEQKQGYMQKMFGGKLRFKTDDGGEYPAWEEKQLGEVVKLRNGVSHRDSSNGKIPVYGSNGITGYTDKPLSDEPGIIYGRKGTITNPQHSKTPFWASDTAIYATSLGSNCEFIFQRSKRIPFMSLATTTGVPSMTQSALETYALSIPSLPEQEKIASLLSKLDEKIEKTADIINLYKSQKTAYTQRIFSGGGDEQLRFTRDDGSAFPAWTEVPLNQVMTPVNYKRVDNPTQYETLTVKLNMKGIVSSGRNPNATSNARPYYRRRAGELLIGRQNFHNGGFGVVTDETDGLIASNAIAGYTPNSKSSFVYHLLSFHHKKFGMYLEGTGQKEIPQQVFDSITLPVPSLPEQRKIADFLGGLDDRIQQYEVRLDHLKQEKTAYMQKMFAN